MQSLSHGVSANLDKHLRFALTKSSQHRWVAKPVTLFVPICKSKQIAKMMRRAEGRNHGPPSPHRPCHQLCRDPLGITTGRLIAQKPSTKLFSPWFFFHAGFLKNKGNKKINIHIHAYRITLAHKVTQGQVPGGSPMCWYDVALYPPRPAQSLPAGTGERAETLTSLRKYFSYP